MVIALNCTGLIPGRPSCVKDSQPTSHDGLVNPKTVYRQPVLLAASPGLDTCLFLAQYTRGKATHPL